MLPESCGPLEGAWRACGLRIVALPRLCQPRLLLRHDGPPCAFLPVGATGPMREVFFGWLVVELARRHGDWPSLAARLSMQGEGIDHERA